MSDALEFFREKKPWSRYKDLILDYYLQPYLAKVAVLRRPILVLDCFAGPGRFDDGQPGSPLIISNRLQSVQGRGAQVLGFYVEKDPALCQRLQDATKNSEVPVQVRQGDFRQHVPEITQLARNHTVFAYLDPIKPSELFFADLEPVYDLLKQGQSIEVLINLMSTSFLRAARSLVNQLRADDGLPCQNHSIVRWNAVAGGTYWQDIACDSQMSNVESVERLAKGYAETLREKFEWVIRYPIRAKYGHKFPKYHLTFGSRHPDAIELMNRAMVKAQREFVGACFVDGFLFPNQPEKEVVEPHAVERAVVETSQTVGKTTWRDLRVRATIAKPCTHTDSEFDSAIKRAIQKGSLASNCSGKRIDNNAWIWPPQQG